MQERWKLKRSSWWLETELGNMRRKEYARVLQPPNAAPDMSLAAVALWIALLWLVVHTVKYARSRPKFILPFSQNRSPTIGVTVKHLNIRLKTVALNGLHDELSTQLSPNKSRTLRRILLRLYDLGSGVAVVGMLLGFCLLLLTVVSLSSELLHTGHDVRHGASTVMKRGLDDAGQMAPAYRINPIVSLPSSLRGSSTTRSAQFH